MIRARGVHVDRIAFLYGYKRNSTSQLQTYGGIKSLKQNTLQMFGRHWSAIALSLCMSATPFTFSVQAAAGDVIFPLVSEPVSASTESVLNEYASTEEYIADYNFLTSLGIENGLASILSADTVVQNPYGNDYIANNQFILPHALTMNLSGYTDLKYQVSVTINDYNADQFVPATDDPSDVPCALIYAQDSSYAVWYLYRKWRRCV